ncbi:MAG: hypothetical protein Dasosvirus3_36 [Dasosvirus sp.]|uniref:Uncharacterized protein n=1 Tax=Dasosvirus sp. TaxID=2487764 RepID=A0A3G4ZRF9_9VIRU|nr:MAG: hypothetical protein Dasosvirus3_36 [Dasosvirus sp.]
MNKLFRVFSKSKRNYCSLNPDPYQKLVNELQGIRTELKELKEFKRLKELKKKEEDPGLIPFGCGIVLFAMTGVVANYAMKE